MKPCEIILPLDFETREEAKTVLQNIGPELKWVKIGLQMYTAFGNEWVREIAGLGYKIFLDMKLHDIPNTVAKSVQSLSTLPINMLTLHTCGGVEMMSEANKVRLDLKPDLLLLGVTVLTSMNESQLNRVGVAGTPQDQVINLASAAVEAGIPGLVSSAKELEALVPQFGGKLKFVTPGIRPAGSSADDQKRVMTPGLAASAGANYLVIGRPIYKAENPKAVVDAIHEEIAQAV